MASKQEIFEKTLTNAFSMDSFVDFIREMVSGVRILAPDNELKTYNTFAAFVSKYYHVGEYEDSDGDNIGIFAVELKRGESIERARSAQRSFVKTLLEKGGYAGALVAFYAEGMNVMMTGTWRFSFIRMDYEFAKGKITETLTPAKRYSYLVGKGEPCHTAMDRLFPIFVDDEYPPTLDELEEAFSVETVTNEFFAKYKEKYLEMQEFLEENEDFKRESEYRGFTSEQFTKKLLSQIVFLYFVQKKGWLGVNAIPPVLSESEYKNAFYKKGYGSKPKEIIPLVYQKKGELYHRNGKAFLSLSEQDEELLSKIVKGQRWGTGPKNFMRNIFDDCVKRGKNFFDDYLEPLFYTGLNQNRGDDAYFQPLHCRIPFLNGGLFEELDNYDWENNDFQIPNEMFSNMDTMGREADGVLDIFDRYNFTMAEDEPMEREVAVDPEMLGKVFENLLEVRDRKSKGAFYTPREIVHYMCQESLINYLVTRSGISEEDIRKFVLYGEYFKEKDAEKTLKVPNKNGNGFHMELDKNKDFEMPPSIFSYKEGTNRLKEIDDLLASVKVVDPAVGSGAFPLGMLNEIIKARDTLSTYMTLEMNAFDKKAMFAPGFVGSRSFYDLKAETIKNCIFACDIEPSATDIAKLRLWLSLVIDDELSDDAMNDGMFGEHSKPKQLPNLDCNIICGNSLDDTFGGVDLIKESDILNNIAGEHQENMMQSGVDAMISTLIDLQDKLYYTKEPHEKAEIKEKIQAIYDAIIEEQLQFNPELLQEYRDSLSESSRPFVLWQLYFPRVFKDNGGFDICIGNPPYIQLQKALFEGSKQRMGDLYKHLEYETFFRMGDLYCLFMELGYKLLSDEGTLSFINPNTWLQSISFTPVRRFLTTKFAWMQTLITPKVFENATVDTHCLLLCKNARKVDCKIYRMEKDHRIYYLHAIPKEWISNVEDAINIELNPSITTLAKKMLGKATTIGDEMKVSNGVKPFSKGRGTPPQTAEVVKTHPYVKEGDKPGDDWMPLMRGSLMNRYENKWKENYWILYGEKLAEPRNPEIFKAPEKIIVRQTGDSIVATIIGAHIICRDNLHVCVPSETNYATTYILGVMNSKATDFVYRFINPEKGEALAQVKKKHVEMLPIPHATEKEQNNISLLVKTILNKKKKHEDTSEEEKAIDSYIYKLYGLSEQEIAMIEGF